ncbi:hypothetical protein ACLGIH_19825 [Streptomyces sp. HMX87]|uniref:hypothetical protein n=1 Tax=Streptomyces sp. HMX87 TaxID=3390849 RepID=UPI003A88886C
MNHSRQARLLSRLHLTLTVIWALLAIPTLLWWPNSILWVAFMSLYANVAAHWSAFHSAQAEREAEKDN